MFKVASIYAALALSVAVLRTAGQTGEKITFAVKGVTKQAAVHSFEVRYIIANNGKSPVLLPRIGTDNAYAPVGLRVQYSGGARRWITLPDYHELPASSTPLKIEPGKTYEGTFILENPYPISAWAAYPRPPYSIHIRGQLRLILLYFLGEDEWNLYLSRLLEQATGPQQFEIYRKQAHEVDSNVFQLAPTSDAIGQRRPT